MTDFIVLFFRSKILFRLFCAKGDWLWTHRLRMIKIKFANAVLWLKSFKHSHNTVNIRKQISWIKITVLKLTLYVFACFFDLGTRKVLNKYHHFVIGDILFRTQRKYHARYFRFQLFFKSLKTFVSFKAFVRDVTERKIKSFTNIILIHDGVWLCYNV